MRRCAGPRLEGFAILAGVGLVAALALRRPELAAAAAPFALALVVGMRPLPDPGVHVSFEVESERTVEGEEVDAEIRLSADAPVDRLEIFLPLPVAVELQDGVTAIAMRLARDEARVMPISLRCLKWGLYDIGELRVRALTTLRLVSWETTVAGRHRLKVYPSTESLSLIVPPRETQVFTGSEVARVKGDGIEYADLREYVPGDRLKSINWRASARRNGLVVNERHPERNTDVVLFVDSFADVRREDRSTLDDAVRATASLATRYLGRRDRVGLVTFGGVLRWLEPGMGLTQRYRLVETLLETGVEPTYVWRDVSIIPARILPPKALILAVTPLVDPRIVATLGDLRARGFDVAVVEVDPVPVIEYGENELERLAFRLWVLQREVLRARIVGLGIAIARWTDDVALEAALEEVRTFRRNARLTRV